MEKFRSRDEASEARKEAVMKLSFKKTAQGQDVMISSQLANLQATCRAGLLKQIMLSFEAGPSDKEPLRR